MGAWLTVLDVGLFALLVYYIYLNVRNTQAVQLIKGILVLFLLYWLSTSLHLWLVGRMLEASVTGLFVAIPVIFQPELRRALQRLGESPRLFESTDRDAAAASANLVAMTAQHLSSLGWGALMVIEMEAGLEEYIASGTRLDAVCSGELLETIFMPGTPLHDGAVVLKEGRIVAAGCFLPLTQRSLDKNLGSRHRAALGISEVTDAIVVVVSEETRNVSIAVGGTLYRSLKPDEVRKTILSRYMGRRGGAGGGRARLWGRIIGLFRKRPNKGDGGAS